MLQQVVLAQRLIWANGPISSICRAWTLRRMPVQRLLGVLMCMCWLLQEVARTHCPVVLQMDYCMEASVICPFCSASFLEGRLLQVDTFTAKQCIHVYTYGS
jgi:hypothetical protein